ncbi:MULTISPECIES: M20/M25/M40 family metallo-hydrolase [unclassified Chelatococcus]|uniref:M20/M25/M40 family metallo-hydrolase n=1 Tax=unclassified Chelatococcus TaxID=2638111 RepID=UPI001BCFFFF0|nr:M20/M25/M40 family metallo-hydrolase [Chelatococcus sp.]MBS7743156.1 M20/M25/M40 family metallo-hydrolase [Chelatococcus sp. HY11]CAH1651540.1 Acetylornithine deacetylase/Succinyl-diaminopimelate desuccinylase and related deacylases [Hyphomicrobiales bacterium]MBX3541726.1 M20/M25/M40 family metallo-hydrolase [Chelatococcus sp.]MCO5074382.1 M20/M25/M40 family metallo-hydrolase [Chelatococcus sp.]CAH1693311.1 Acetylornithine deacetylase/Succinyl-diaminopimelate desuccinylase and related deac
MTQPLSPLAQDALDLAEAWCRIPSVRGNDQALDSQAAAVSHWLSRELGATIINDSRRDGRPAIIHARLDVGAAHTVILYNMYDVMPADPAGWSVAPFSGGIVDLPEIGACFVGRGAENNKGPLAGMLAVLKQMAESGALAVNVEILVEGEEESGSGALRAYLLDPACPLRASIGGLFPSFCEYGGGPPRVYLGFSGIAKGEVSVEGGAWGGPRAAIHSSNAPWIANPASRLIAALALFGRSPTGGLGRITLDAEARAIVADLAASFDPQAELSFRKTDRFALEGDADALLTRVLTTASATINSLATEPLAGDAIIPHAARATFDLRCPPSLDPAEYLAGFRETLQTAGLDGVSFDVADAYPGTRFTRDAAGVGALLAAYAATSTPPQIWPWAIGAAPGYAFARHADSFLIGGAGRGGNAHGIDEFMTLEGFERFLKSIAIWLTEVAKVPAPGASS